MRQYYQITLVISALIVGFLSSCGGSRKGVSPANSQKPFYSTSKNAYENYIRTYAPQALASQQRFGIPASITLAQGLLESAAGQSDLARNANNHFGIKCHKSWTGGRAYHTDDRPNECFRAYNTVLESYSDHAYFLSSQARYQDLFRMDLSDYKGWAKGLQSAGYATDRGYANKLIKIIEDYQLYLVTDNNPSRKYSYNDPKQPPRNVKNQPLQYEKPATQDAGVADVREVYISYGLYYTLAKPNDDLASIARDLGATERALERYNDFPKGYPLQGGDIVYLERKLLKAEPPYYEHVVKVGESIHAIAQRYGIQLKSLYRMNGLTQDYYPEEGDVLRLR